MKHGRACACKRFRGADKGALIPVPASLKGKPSGGAVNRRSAGGELEARLRCEGYQTQKSPTDIRRSRVQFPWRSDSPQGISKILAQEWQTNVFGLGDVHALPAGRGAVENRENSGTGVPRKGKKPTREKSGGGYRQRYPR